MTDEDVRAANAALVESMVQQLRDCVSVGDEMTLDHASLIDDAADWIAGEPARLAAKAEEVREALGLDQWPVLIPFLAAMVRKLDANKAKKGGREGWKNDDPSALVRRVIEEAEELEHAVDTKGAREILLEAADVANMALMVADAAGALDATPLDARPLAAEEKAEEGVRYWTDLAQAEARDAAALRTRVAELEAQLSKAEASEHARAVLAKHPEGKR